MSQPPYGPGPERPQDDRPQDRPHDPTRAFPTYGRPEQPQAPGSPGAQGGAPWAAPGQPSYGSQQSTYGQAGAGQAPAGPTYGQGYGPGQYPPAYGQAPGPYGYGGYGYGGSGGTNGLATAALVTGLGGFVIGVSAPVAIGLGIAALVQIKRSQQEGKGMAIAGLVMGSLVTLGYTLLILLVIVLGSGSDDSYSAPDPVSSSNSGPTTYVDELTVGECFDEGSEEDEVVRQPCPDAHDGEVVAIVSLPGTTYPGDSAINKAADRACAPPFGTYVGKSRDQSELYLDWWTPSKGAWDDGDHRVLCAAFGPDDDKLTGTVKNSHR